MQDLDKTKPKNKARLAKEEKVEKLSQEFGVSKSVIFWDYSGITVTQFVNLRQKLQDLGSKITVAKNTLIELALKKAKLGKFESFEGPTAILQACDELDSLKILVNFIKTESRGCLKFGFLGKELKDTAELEYLAGLPSREVVLGTISNYLRSPIYNLVNVLGGNLANLVYILSARN